MRMDYRIETHTEIYESYGFFGFSKKELWTAELFVEGPDGLEARSGIPGISDHASYMHKTEAKAIAAVEAEFLAAQEVKPPRVAKRGQF